LPEQLTHWKKLTHPDYIGSYAFLPGEEMILTISEVKQEVIIGSDGKKETCTIMRFAEPNVKPLILNKTNQKTIQRTYRTPYIEKWIGKKVQLYVALDVKAFGELVDAVRIREYVPECTCSDCQKEITPLYQNGAVTFSVWQIAKTTKDKYDRVLCMDCGAKEKAARKAPAQEQVKLDDTKEDTAE